MSLQLPCPACRQPITNWNSPDDCACNPRAPSPISEIPASPVPLVSRNPAKNPVTPIADGGLDAPRVTVAPEHAFDTPLTLEQAASGNLNKLATCCEGLASLSSGKLDEKKLNSIIGQVLGVVNLVVAFSMIPSQIMVHHFQQIHRELVGLVKRHCAARLFAPHEPYLHAVESENANRSKTVEWCHFLPHMHWNGHQFEQLTAIFVGQPVSSAHTSLVAATNLAAIRELLALLGMPSPGLLVATPVSRKIPRGKWKNGLTLWASYEACELLRLYGNERVFVCPEGYYLADTETGLCCIRQLNHVAAMLSQLRIPNEVPGTSRASLSFARSDLVQENISRTGNLHLRSLLPGAE